MYVYCVNAYNSADHMSFRRIPNGFNPYVYVYLLTVFLKYNKASFELMSVASEMFANFTSLCVAS